MLKNIVFRVLIFVNFDYSNNHVKTASYEQ
jgi:hypothetical protein